MFIIKTLAIHSKSKIPIMITLLIISITTLFASSKVSALSGSDFNAGRIIDDSVFFNSNSMSANEIQQFLSAKVPTCDTNGSQIYSGSTTRAQYGSSRGYPAPYICLKDYSQSIPSVINSGSDLCTGSINAGTKNASQIIYDTAQACGISPKVLLVLLQKEQSLVTDDWPWSIQYRSATGYGCPDTAPCDSEYYGFFNQVYQAAKAYKRYQANIANYNYRANRNNIILWHPNGACGSSNVYIENQATAGLYIYTPYRPNQAALNNLYGTGDSCSSYGNRNFWRMFSDWFGTTKTDESQVQLVSDLAINPGSNVLDSDTLNVSFTLRNNSNNSVNIGSMAIGARRIKDNINFDFGKKDVVIPPHSTYTYTSSTKLPDDQFSFEIINYRSWTGWSNDFPISLHNSLIRKWSPYTIMSAGDLSSGLSINSTNSSIGSNYTATFSIKNNSTKTTNIGKVAVAVRGPQGQNMDYTPDNNVTIPAGSTYTYSKTQRFNIVGNYTFEIVNYRDGVGWNKKTPNGNLTRVVNLTTINNPSITSSLHLSPNNPVIGQDTTASFLITNSSDSPINIGKVAVAVRGPQGQNMDYTPDNNVTIPAGSTYTYSKTQRFNIVGNYTFEIVNYRDGVGWNSNYPVSSNASIVRKFVKQFTVDKPTITASLHLSPNNPVIGQDTTASFLITNSSDSPINIGKVAVAVRGPQGQNMDYTPDNNVTIPAGSTYTYSKTQRFNIVGNYTFEIVNYRDGVGWNSNYPVKSPGIVGYLPRNIH